MKHIVIAAIGTLAFAASAAAQDARWTPWLGCWDLAQGTQGARVCVERAGDNAVTLRTTLEGQPVLEQTIVADGTSRPVNDADCRGTQREEWSADGQLLFAHADLTCAADKPRTVSGLALIAPDGTWLDVQSVLVDGRESTRVRRYRRGADALAALPRPVAPLTLDAIVEASRHVSPTVVEAAIVETHTTFDLNSRSVIRLADAAVPERLIDVMIALSYPRKFVVERTSPDPLLPPPLYLDADPYYYASYYYSPFAFGYGGYYFPYAFYPTFGVDSGVGGDGGSKPQPSGSGRAINGVGYTRVTARQEPAQPVSNSSGGTGSTGGSSGSGSSSGGSTVTSQGYSGGGGSGGDGGRTAVPR